ncbi:MAG: DoxX family protein [Verrucomicrobium sp.]
MKIALWMVQGLLAFAFGASGYMKVFAFHQFAASAPDLANQQSLFTFIGMAELAGAVGLILPALTGVLPVLTTWAAVGLGTIMVLGTGLHIMKGEWSHAAITLVLLALNAFVVWGRGWGVGSPRKSTLKA